MRLLGSVLLSVLVLALAGCGLAEKAADAVAEKAIEKAVETATGVSVDSSNNSVTIKGQDGKEMTIEASDEGKLPEGFPLPVYKGGRVTTSATMSSEGKKGWTLEIEFDADPVTVGDFYENVLKEQGLNVTRTDSESEDETFVTLIGASETHSAFITITSYEKGKAVASMMYGDK